MHIVKWTIPEELKTDKGIESVLIFTKTGYFNARNVFLGRKNCVMIFRDDQIHKILFWHSWTGIEENCLSRNIVIMNDKGEKVC